MGICGTCGDNCSVSMGIKASYEYANYGAIWVIPVPHSGGISGLAHRLLVHFHQMPLRSTNVLEMLTNIWKIVLQLHILVYQLMVLHTRWRRS